MPVLFGDGMFCPVHNYMVCAVLLYGLQCLTIMFTTRK